MLSKILSLLIAAWIGITIVWIGSETVSPKGWLKVATCFFSVTFAYWLLDYLTESED